MQPARSNVRVMAYVDGANLYYAIRRRCPRKYQWLDVEVLVRSLLKEWQSLVGVKLFTARLRDNPHAQNNQAVYLDALRARCERLEIIEGRFDRAVGFCQACGTQWATYVEKETDANIVSSIVEDGVRQKFDTALLISADADLSPAIRSLRRLCSGAKVVVGLPPSRRSYNLEQEATATFTIGPGRVRQATLPERVKKADGTTLRRPDTWN